MSRRRSSSSVMGPPPDRDVVMGPPPVPAPLSNVQSAPPPPPPPQRKSKDSQDIAEKYRKLKRRFFELEEKHKETNSELQRSSERNVKMREERSYLLDRIIELESIAKPSDTGSASPSQSATLPQASSSAFPRTLLNARARTSFIANLRQAIAEDDADDDVDPVLSSRHTGPQAKRREEEERRDRLEEEAREYRKSTRKSRSSHGGNSHKSKDTSGSTSNQPLMTFSPAVHHSGSTSGSPPQDSTTPPTLVSSTGTRLRLKPPAPPSGATPQSDRMSPPIVHNAVASSSSSSSSRAHSHEQSPLPSAHSHSLLYTHPPPLPPPHYQPRSHQSPPHRSKHYPHQDEGQYGRGGEMEVEEHQGSAQGFSPQPADSRSLTRDTPDIHDRNLEERGSDLVNSPLTPQSDANSTSHQRNEISNVTISDQQDEEGIKQVPKSNRRGGRSRRTSRTNADAVSTHNDRTRDSVVEPPVSPPISTTSPPRRVTTLSGGRTTRSESAALAAAAAAAVAAEIEAGTEADTTDGPIPNSPKNMSPQLPHSPSGESTPLPVTMESPPRSPPEQASSLPLVRSPSPPNTSIGDGFEDVKMADIQGTEEKPNCLPYKEETLSPLPPAASPADADAVSPDYIPSPIHSLSPPYESSINESTHENGQPSILPLPRRTSPVLSSIPAPQNPSESADSAATRHESSAEYFPSVSPVVDEDISMEGPQQSEQPQSPLTSSLGVAATSTEISGTSSTPDVEGSNLTEGANHTTDSKHQASPSMDNIVKVAEAAVAAQNHAERALETNTNRIQSHPSIDPNLDPSLIAESVNQSQKNPATQDNRSSSNGSSNSSTNGTCTNGIQSHANQNSATATPSPTISNNPYLSMMPKLHTATSPTPSGHPMASLAAINPYSMYYPTPGTPLSPSTPGYPHPYANPYYYLAAPVAGPSGMYPLSPNFIPPSSQRPPSDVQRHAKPKRLKAHTVTSKSFSIPMVPRDKKGKPMLPLNVGIMTVIKLGDVCMREHFHTERYIFPVGYEVTRRYLSTVDPNIEVVYHCTILDGGDGPKFQIVPSDVPDRPVIAGTATGAWSNIVKQANAIRNRQHSNSVSGPDFFGLGQNTIKHLIQELPNADRLRDYVWQNFVEGGPLGGRHAAVIPALPEEYDASMPIGAYYPSEREKMKREASGPPESPRGMSHYPQHILAQAEAQKMQQEAVQQAKQQAHQHSQQQQLAAQRKGGNSQKNAAKQVMLPSPSSPSSFQEYLPTPVSERRTTRSHTNHVASSTPIVNTRQVSKSPRTRSEISQTNANSQGVEEPKRSPYLASVTTPAASASPPAVPATFASIMNAYPIPATSGSPHPIAEANE